MTGTDTQHALKSLLDHALLLNRKQRYYDGTARCAADNLHTKVQNS